MKNAIVLHGTGSNPQGNWFPWIKKELEKRNWTVWVPNLPQSEIPNIKRYNKYLLKNRRWKFNKNSVIIGHSSGAVAILGLLQHFPKKLRINTCILVSAFKDNLGWDALDELFEEPFDYKQIKNHAQRFILIHSNNDPYCPLSHAKFLAKKLNGKLIIKKGQGHFNLKKGPQYTKFPALMEILEKEGLH